MKGLAVAAMAEGDLFADERLVGKFGSKTFLRTKLARSAYAKGAWDNVITAVSLSFGQRGVYLKTTSL